MKRQASISAFFTKKSTEKKPKGLTEPQEESSTQEESLTSKSFSTTKVTLSQDALKNLHDQFQQKFGPSHQKPLVQTNPTVQKLTPLETQVVDLKAKYPTCLLLVEVGYKFRFFGEDALIASRVLHIAHFIDRNFHVASFPVHRLDVHVNR